MTGADLRRRTTQAVARPARGAGTIRPGRCDHCAYSLIGANLEVAIRKMGNSQGVLIPKPILAQVGLEGSADLQVRDGVIEIRPVRRDPRAGWADDALRVAQQGSDALVWPELANKGDDEWVW